MCHICFKHVFHIIQTRAGVIQPNFRHALYMDCTCFKHVINRRVFSLLALAWSAHQRNLHDHQELALFIGPAPIPFGPVQTLLAWSRNTSCGKINKFCKLFVLTWIGNQRPRACLDFLGVQTWSGHPAPNPDTPGPISLWPCLRTHGPVQAPGPGVPEYPDLAY